MLKLLWIFILSANLVYAQNENPKEATLQERAAEEAKIREEILKKYRPQEVSEKTQPDTVEKNDSEEIEDISKLPQELKDKINDENLFGAILENSSEDNPNVQDSFLSNMISSSMKDVISKFLKSNPLSKLSKEEVRSMILTQAEDKPAAELFKNYPKFLDFMVDWIRDPKALPAFIGIINKTEEMKNFGIAVLIVFILSFILNFLNRNGNLAKRIFKKILISIGALVINLVLFYLYFKDEIGPTIDIAKKYLFS